MGRILRRSSVSLGSGSRSRVVAIIALLLCPLALGQSSPGAATEQPETVVDVLHQLSDKADVIFAGQVLAIRRPGNGVVEVEFRVDEAIRGCTSGTTYTLREWAGLWMADDQRYRVGQRLLMLLHSPGAGGLSSPVSGLDGAIPIRQGGPAAHAGSFVCSVAPPRVRILTGAGSGCDCRARSRIAVSRRLRENRLTSPRRLLRRFAHSERGWLRRRSRLQVPPISSRRRRAMQVRRRDRWLRSKPR